MDLKERRREIVEIISHELMIEDLSENDRFDTLGISDADKYSIIVKLDNMGFFVSESDFEEYPEISDFLDNVLDL